MHPKPPPDAQVEPSDQVTYNAAQRTRVLVVVSLAAFLVPLTTTIYLPALSIIEKELTTTSVMVGLTISGYVLLAGLMPLVYAPFADRLGRRRILLVSLGLYVVTSVLCALSWNIWSLIAFRTLQALGVSAATVVGAGAIADVYPPQSRGRAMGMFGVAPLIGPVIGPLIGGIIINAVGWRGLFLTLAALGAVVLAALAIWMPETLSKARIPKTPPRPWEPLLLLRNPSLLLLSLLGGVVFATMYATVTLLPLLLHRIYNMGPMAIGLAFLPYGVAGLLGTTAGGIAADRLGRKRSLILGSIVIAPVVALFGFWVGSSFVMAMVLLGGVGFLLSFARPAMSTYAVEMTPQHASSITAATMALALVFASISATAAPALSGAIGTGPFFGIMAALITIATVAAALGMEPDKAHRAPEP